MITTTQLCTFFLDKQMFGVEVQSVQEVIRYQEMTEVPLAPDSVCGLINLRGQIVTAIDLRRRLGLNARPADRLPMNVIIRSDDGPISFLVDQIGDVLEVDDEDFELPPETLTSEFRCMIRGASKMKTGLLLILDFQHAMNVSGNDD